MKKVKPSSKHYRPHVVDKATKSVYVSVRSWGGAISAPHWVHAHYQGYKCVILSEEKLQEKLGEEF